MQIQHLSWSPDGTKLMFTGGSHIYVNTPSAGTSNYTQLTEGNTPHWSEDGSKITFQKGYNIYHMNENGSNLTQVTDFGSSANPKWSPDGNWILFESHYNNSENANRNRLFIVNKLGGQLTVVTDDENESIYGQWGP